MYPQLWFVLTSLDEHGGVPPQRSAYLRTHEGRVSREDRLRFLKEVVDAVADEVGAERTAIRLARF